MFEAKRRTVANVNGVREMLDSLTRPVRIGVFVAYGLAAALFALLLADGEFPLSLKIEGAVASAAVVATPPTLALLSSRRPMLLLAAGVASVSTLLGLSILGIPMVIVGIVWVINYQKSNQGASATRAIAMAAVAWVLTVGAFVVLFLHVDPVCFETLTDGTTREIAPIDEAGWVWEVGSSSSGSQTIGTDVASSACSSDTIVFEEAAVSLTLVLMAVAVAWRLAQAESTESP